MAYPFGRDADVAPAAQPRFDEIKNEVLATLAPANALESIVAGQILIAVWEAEQLRELADQGVVNDLTRDAASRAERNPSALTRNDPPLLTKS
jgi:hypothetical protein